MSYKCPHCGKSIYNNRGDAHKERCRKIRDVRERLQARKDALQKAKSTPRRPGPHSAANPQLPTPRGPQNEDVLPVLQDLSEKSADNTMNAGLEKADDDERARLEAEIEALEVDVESMETSIDEVQAQQQPDYSDGSDLFDLGGW